MKYFIFKSLIIFFFISGFSKVFSQENKLEISYDINEDGGDFSDTGDILVEYNIKNGKGEIIGSVILNSSMDEFQYFNLKKEIVAYRWNFGRKNISPFTNKKTEISVRDKKTRNIIFSQKWNPEKERFDTYSTGNQLIGNMFLNLKSGLWELYNIQTSLNIDNSIFANYFEVNSGKKTSSAVKSTNKIVTVRVMSDDGLMEKIIKRGVPGPKIFIESTKNYATLDKYGSYFIKGTIGDILIVSFGGYETYKATIGSSKKVTVILKSKKKKDKKYQKPIKVNGLGVNISKGGSNKTRLGLEWHGPYKSDNNSIGLTVGFKKSNTLVSDEYNLSDLDFGFTYGKSYLGNRLKLKVGLGFGFYNYDVIESFGPFYDIGEELYYSAGLQLYIPIGIGFTLDGYYNNYGLGYGIGFKF